MKLSDALSRLRPIVGLTSLIGAPNSISVERAGTGTALAEAQNKLAAAKAAQDACRSDAAYWGYEGQVAFWRCVVDLLKAAEITGPDNLPDVNLPDLEGGIVMDLCGRLEGFGRTVLCAAKATA